MRFPAQQLDLTLGAIAGGSYEIGGHVARWKCRSDDPKTIDLNFLGSEFEVTQESAGSGGRPRLYVNGFTQPDGKLLQGRSLQELIRKLYEFGEKIICRLDRIETKIDLIQRAVKPRARRVSGLGKLCTVPVTVTWGQERYVPRSAIGGFSRVPLSAIPASQEMAAGEYRLLQAILFCAQGTGLLAAGKSRLSKLASVDPAHVKHFRRSLCNRGLIRPTGLITGNNVRVYELLTHPWLVSSTLDLGGRKLSEQGQNQEQRGATFAPLKKDKTINKKMEKKAGTVPQAKCDLSPAATAKEQVEESDSEWLERLSRAHGFDPEIEWAGFRKKCKKWETRPTRKMFENYWIPNIQPTAQPKIKETAEIEPPGFSSWWEMQAFAGGPKCPPWSEAPDWAKNEFLTSER
jgi:hypothetical protein